MDGKEKPLHSATASTLIANGLLQLLHEDLHLPLLQTALPAFQHGLHSLLLLPGENDARDLMVLEGLGRYRADALDDLEDGL